MWQIVNILLVFDAMWLKVAVLEVSFNHIEVIIEFIIIEKQ